MTVINKHSRMPRKYTPEEPKTEKRELNAVQIVKLRETDPMVILQRYLSDESTESIAASYGVTRQGLGQYLLRTVEEEWKEAQVARAIARKEKAEDSIELATDPLQLARARELLKAAQWDLERTCRRIYGEDKAQAIISNPQLHILVMQQGKEKQGTSETAGTPALVHVSIAHADSASRPGAIIEGEIAAPAMIEEKP
jgi:hypothetical protein